MKHGVGLTIDVEGDKEVGVWHRDKLMISGIKYDCPPFQPNWLRTGASPERIEFKDGSIYHGEWDEYVFHGNGTLTKVLDSGALEVYTGLFSHGKKHGKGVLNSPEGTVYGVWYEDELLIPSNKDILKETVRFAKLCQGEESVVYSNGDTYEGEWEDCRKNGEGTYTWADGSVYKGTWRNDEQTGYGVYTTWKDENKVQHHDSLFKTQETTAELSNSFVEGDLESGVKSGSKKTKVTYSGLWKYCELKVRNVRKKEANDDENSKSFRKDYDDDDELNYISVDDIEKGCFEIIKFKDGSKYEGMWEDFKMHGRGIYTFASGRQYQGNFKNGLFHGYGKVYDEQHNLEKEGCWFEDLQISSGIPDPDQMRGNLYGQAIQYQNGDKFTGSLVNFQKEGKGGYIYAKGGDYNGFFKDNYLHGYGKFSFMGKTRTGIWLRDQQIRWLGNQKRNILGKMVNIPPREMERLQLKYLESILNFRYLQSKSQMEGVKFLEKMKAKNVDIFDQFQELLMFKIQEERDKIEDRDKLEDGEVDYDGDWEIMRQDQQLSESRIELFESEQAVQDARNKYRDVLRKLKEDQNKGKQSLNNSAATNPLEGVTENKLTKDNEEPGNTSGRTNISESHQEAFKQVKIN
jgi:hypothetical protein